MTFFAPSGASAPGALTWLNARDYGALGDGTHDDTSALQAWIDAAIATGQAGWLPAGSYKITATLVIAGRCTLHGAGVRDSWGSVVIGAGVSGTIAPQTAPYLYGSVIVQSTAATDALHVTVVGESVNLADFGVTFTPPFVNTGHAIKAQAPNKTSFADTGPTACQWKNLAVYGHDGNHYAYYIVNPLIMTRTDCRSYGGGGLYLRGESDVNYFFGNYIDIGSYHAVFLGGSAHGFSVSAQAAHHINLCQFHRPQAWVMDVSSFWTLGSYVAPTSAQSTFTGDANTTDIAMYCPDMETNVHAPFRPPLDGFTLHGAGVFNSLTGFSGTLCVTPDAKGAALSYLGESVNNLVTAGYYIIATTDAGSSPLAVRSATGSIMPIQLWQNQLGQTLASVASNGDGAFNALQATAGARITSGSGAPSAPGGQNPTAGDLYARTDTPATANQRLYCCTVGGATPTWVGIA